MADESFILMSLKENKAKKLAQVISNETSRKILDFLAHREATESEIAAELSLPISTVHYNMKHLVESKLVLADEFHYSKKGKEVLHYKLARKLIVIAPQDMDDSSVSDALKSILPVGVLVIAATALVHFLTRSGEVARNVAPMAKSFAADIAADMVVEESAQASPAALRVAQAPMAPTTNEPNLALWFGLGALCALVIVSAVILIRRYLKSRAGNT